jgi:hypothetical protein
VPDGDVPERWSTLEYGAHVRDVYVLFSRRLEMMLDTDDPLFPNWDQDETAVASRYDLEDPSTVTSGRVRGGARMVPRSPSTPLPDTSSTIRCTTSGIAGSLRPVMCSDLQSAP